MRPQTWFLKEILAMKKSHPGPAIQVRRQDKFHESKFLPLANYVNYISDYFDFVQAKLQVRVYFKNSFYF